ncbi:WYL domain-containing protein [Pseudoduganella sp. FT93W]|uniref:WYL domain-containing protein n=1 Tax=Duganella fentianensis TaxID=2692177 RepID=A0A845HY10_9BURK|nr:WYL domain-containing protein [Duganella fentianensis]MYN45903.1 WYL domain-containing protein [Duganella fentianensis]
MNQTERLYRIDQLLHERAVVPLGTFLRELEVSHATFKRDLDYLRGRLNAPIEWDRDAGGYRFGVAGAGGQYELPGLWFNPAEIYALLTMRQLLSSLGPGLLTAQVEPLLARMRLLMGEEGVSIDVFEQRIRILRLNARTCEPEHFMPVATAVMNRKRLLISHHNRFRDETLQREISPQRLTHYRENWYVDAWCHLRNEIRSFGLSAMCSVTITEDSAVEVSAAELGAVLDSGYGIFGGREIQWAELVFSRERARWVSQETWHDRQESWFDDEDCYHLRFPYSDPREVSMDILRHVPEVSVVSPSSLRETVTDLLHAALKRI